MPDTEYTIAALIEDLYPTIAVTDEERDHYQAWFRASFPEIAPGWHCTEPMQLVGDVVYRATVMRPDGATVSVWGDPLEALHQEVRRLIEPDP